MDEMTIFEDEARILRYLLEMDPVPRVQIDIATATDISRRTCSKILERLLDIGLIRLHGRKGYGLTRLGGAHAKRLPDLPRP